MNKKSLEKGELISLNSELSEFDLQQLEQRLETDPLAIGGLLDLASSDDLSQSVRIMSSNECGSCSWFAKNN